MSNVVQLPEAMHRAWRIFEKDIRAGFADDLRPDEMDHMLAALKPVYLKWANPPEVDLSSGPEAAIAALNDWVRQMTFGLLLSLAVAELKAYHATR